MSDPEIQAAVEPPQVQPTEAVRNPDRTKTLFLFGTPTLGQVRIEWHNAMAGLVTPTNWAHAVSTPTGFLVDDAQNLIAATFMGRADFEWLLLLEDDTIPPADLLLKLRRHIHLKTGPLISGLYHIKGSHPPEPLIYRGIGTGPFRDFTPGDLVWCDGVPTGCLLIHRSLIAALWETSEPYTLPTVMGPQALRRVFETPAKISYEGGIANRMMGTSDLQFCDRILREGALLKTPWPELAEKRFPFVVDTSIRCGHIDFSTGTIY